MPTETAPALLAGLAAFAAADDLSVGKDGFNSHFSYAFMTEPALFTAVRAALAANGLSATISMEQGQHEIIMTTDRDGHEKPQILATVAARITIRDQQGNQVECLAYGQGLDPADKAMAKAQTMASKYVCQKALLVAVEADDTDAQAPTGTVRRSGGGQMTGTASEKQLGFACGLVKKLNLDAGDAETMVLRLARMAGDSATEFAQVSKATASDLIERLQKVEKNPAAAAVIAERLMAWEAEHGTGLNQPEPPFEPVLDADGNPIPF